MSLDAEIAPHEDPGLYPCRGNGAGMYSFPNLMWKRLHLLIIENTWMGVVVSRYDARSSETTALQYTLYPHRDDDHPWQEC
ncbi:hypothetical protein F1880_003816 [Penicillium rolfsii]|nr:hypothetical protein F1880_003816 [Penicillium rolfsii]